MIFARELSASLASLLETLGLLNDLANPSTEPKVRENLKEKLEAIKVIVPQKFSEAEAKRD